MQCNNRCEFYLYNDKTHPVRQNGVNVKPLTIYCLKAKRKVSAKDLSDGRPLWCPVDPCHTTCFECGRLVRSNDEIPLCKSCRRK